MTLESLDKGRLLSMAIKELQRDCRYMEQAINVGGNNLRISIHLTESSLSIGEKYLPDNFLAGVLEKAKKDLQSLEKEFESL